MKGDPGDPTAKKIGEPFIPMLRKFRKHRFWPGNRKVRFDYGWAFIDLWFETTPVATSLFVGKHLVELRPGQAAISRQAKAKEWKWDVKTVDRFLALLESGGEASVKRHHWGVRITLHAQARWWDTGSADAPAERTAERTAEGAALYKRLRDNETTPDGTVVDNSVDNPSMPRKVAEVVEAFQQAAKTDKIPSIPDKVAVEKAINANGGDHIPIRECVRKATAEGVAYAKQSGSDPPRGVRYGLAAWSRRNERGPDPRPRERREPESRPQSPAYHRPVRPVPIRRMTDEESRSGASHVRDLLAKLKLRPDRSQK